MAFYNRSDELSALSILKDGRGGRLIVLIGRRRVGKTTLLKNFLENMEEGVYLYVDSTKKPDVQLAEFSEILKGPLGLPDYFRPKSWEELFNGIYASEVPSIVVFDEFQRFVDIDKGAIISLQKVHDLKHDRTKVNIVISGSSVGMLKRLFVDEKAPLYKRALNMIDLHPFDVMTCFDLYRRMGVKDIEEMVRLYCCFGDLPMMFYLFDEYRVEGFEDALSKLLLRPFAPLRNEVSDTMIESFGKEHPTYFGILSAISMGKRGAVDIANQVGINSTYLSPYMSDLEGIMGVVSPERPVTVDPNSKKGRYILKDRFYKFWFRYFYRNGSLVEMGSWDILKERIMISIEEHVSREVEDLVRDLIKYRKLDIGFSLDRIGGWWNRKGDEIDIVALNDERKIALFGEVKWSKNKVDTDVLEALISKSDLVKEIIGYEKRYMLFNKTGFTKDLKERSDIILFDLGDLRKMLDALPPIL